MLFLFLIAVKIALALDDLRLLKGLTRPHLGFTVEISQGHICKEEGSEDTAAL